MGEALLDDSRAQLLRLIHKWILTATPLVGKHSRKLWPLFNWLNPEEFPSEEEFEKEYPDNVDGDWKLALKLKEFLLRRRMEDVLRGIIPKFTIEHREVSLSEEDTVTYRQMEENFIHWLEDHRKRTGRYPGKNHIFAKLMKMNQFAAGFRVTAVTKEALREDEVIEESISLDEGGPNGEALAPDEILEEDKEEEVAESEEEEKESQMAFDLKNPKVMALDKIIKEKMEKGEKVVVFSKYPKVVQALREKYDDGYGAEAIYGGVSGRAQIVKDFQEKERPGILFLTYPTGGESITLTAANTIVLYDLDWDWPRQPLYRVLRLGQTKEVEAIYLLAETYQEVKSVDKVSRQTIDGDTVSLHEEKKDKDLRIIEARFTRREVSGDITEVLKERMERSQESKEEDELADVAMMAGKDEGVGFVDLDLEEGKEMQGGIDFKGLGVEVEREGEEIEIPVNMEMIENMEFEGFTPVIINITPTTNLPFLLGVSEDGKEEQELSLL